MWIMGTFQVSDTQFGCVGDDSNYDVYESDFALFTGRGDSKFKMASFEVWTVTL